MVGHKRSLINQCTSHGTHNQSATSEVIVQSANHQCC